MAIRRVLYKPRPSFLGITSVGAKGWVPSLALWGAGAGTAVALLMSATPLFKNDVLVKIPVIGSYYEDKTLASDRPF
ncbi:hypothetical protein FRC03_001853 [Tulasnella sp. 419]|nr:hypothetical protein FRC02_003961 [Tulasnella sp. 418]KAG8964369.1 hypothetical protein FRC03_001853 [Tulasnella sp. 419]